MHSCKCIHVLTYIVHVHSTNDKQCWHFNNAWTCWVINSKEQFDNIQQSIGVMRMYDEGIKTWRYFISRPHDDDIVYTCTLAPWRSLNFITWTFRRKFCIYLHVSTSLMNFTVKFFFQERKLFCEWSCDCIDKLSNFDFPFHFITSLHILT